MALQKTIALENGLTVQDAYIRIESVTGTKESMTVAVAAYLNEAAHNAQKPPLDLLKTFVFVPSVADGSANFIEQGYAYLKTLPEFADATDC